MVLGIDTGGTFTDSVIVNTEKKEILCKAKALTTKEDLAKGIRNSIGKLPEEKLKALDFVSLSTTLATNAIVENRRGRTGVILIGKKTDDPLPADIVVEVSGKINIKGQVQKSLEQEQVAEALKTMRGAIDVLAISGFASIRNPVHEQQVKKQAKEVLGVPVVCAHELTGQLGFYQRTVTCALNAGLLPIIKELLTSAKQCLKERKLDIPIMVVKGDGSLMHESVALDRPVETLLSGPAASIIGAEFLTGMDYALILDMGGTTTDIADLTNGRVRIKEEGASVGGWRTRVRAADINTFGLGGDSHIWFDTKGDIQIGPRKVIPISSVTGQWPSLIKELREYRRPEGYELCRESETDCFLFIKEQPGRRYEQQQKMILETLRKQPHSLFWLAEHFQKDAEKLGLTSLVEDGSVGRISFTPTDVLQAEAHIDLYDTKGAKAALEIMAGRKNMSCVDFIIQVKRLLYRKLAGACVQSICDFEGKDFDIRKEPAGQWFLEQAFCENVESILRTKVTVAKPIIAIGAPVKAWMYKAGQYVNTAVIIPEHAEVANAVGAAVGRVLEEAEVRIRYDSSLKQYLIYSSKERIIQTSLDEAKKTAERIAKEIVKEAAEKAGCADYEIAVRQEDRHTEIFTSGAKHYVETIVKSVAIGKPKWSG